MTSPIPPHVSERETVISRLAVPSARIFVATVILLTGAGVSAVFWKMPRANDELHALYHTGVVDPDLATVPLPDNSVAAVSFEEMQQITLPMLEILPVAADGAGKYAQVYPAPAPLAAVHAEQSGTSEEDDSFLLPVIPQAPIRQIIEEKPILVDPVSREFPPQPTSASMTERRDEFRATFHFVENSIGERDGLSEQPADPFPMMVPSAVSSMLQPLSPVRLDDLSPLRPIQEIDMQSLPELVM